MPKTKQRVDLDALTRKEKVIVRQTPHTINSDVIARITARQNAMQRRYDDYGGARFFGDVVTKKARVWTFANGSCICFNEAKNEAYVVYGAIYQRWAELGAERSYLGYPTTDEVDFAQGGRANEFDGGGIYWWGDTGAIDLRDVVVHYTGLHCFGETDWDQSSSADEPYVIVSIATPGATATYRTRVYEEVDAGDSRADLIEIYRGRPYGIVLQSVVMEHDFGDPDRYRKEVQSVVDGAHEVGIEAMKLIPIVGPALAKAAEPELAKLMPKVGGAVNNLFDWGDDRIGASTVTLTAKELCQLARSGNQSFGNLGFKAESGLISGSGASYKTYFGVAPV